MANLSSFCWLITIFFLKLETLQQKDHYSIEVKQKNGNVKILRQLVKISISRQNYHNNYQLIKITIDSVALFEVTGFYQYLQKNQKQSCLLPHPSMYPRQNNEFQDRKLGAMQLVSLQQLQMIFFYNNFDFNANWEQAFNELSYRYAQLNHDYAQAIELRDSLKNKIQNIAKENQELKATKQLRKFHTQLRDDPEQPPSFDISEKQITIRPEKKEKSKIKRQQSGQLETKNEGHPYECTYEGCSKVYSSPVSMNLHIKMKHNGGTKKERQAYARILLQAQQRGEEPPKMNINLPPNFLEEYRTSYEYMKKYSM